MKKQILIVLTLLSCVALSAQTVDVCVCQADKFLAGCAVYDRTDGDQTGISVDIGEKSYTLNLHWGESATFAYTDSIAIGGKYLFGCQVLTEAGTYYDTLTTATGCDSIVTLTLTEYVPCSPVEFAYTDSVAVGGTYIFNCQVLTKAGTYTETLTKADGCDSIVTLTLTEYVPCSPVEFAYTDSVAVGGTYIFNCQVLTKAGTYTETLTKADGCDSVVVLTLKEFTPVVVETHDTLRKSLTANLCYGEAYVTRSETIYPTQDTTFSDTVVILRDTVITLAKTTIHTVDSIYIYDLTVNPRYLDVTDGAIICQGELPYTWADTTWTADSKADTYVVVRNLHTVNGCDSIVTFTLTINPSYTDVTDGATICQGELPYTWADTTWTADSEADTYVVVRNLHTVNGCDSIVTFTLTINPQYLTVTDGATICQGALPYTWADTTWNADSKADTYVVVRNLHTVNGCDSVVTFTLTVLSPYVDSLPAIAKDENWLLMINRRSIRNDYHIDFTADQVQWYRVEGEVDQYPYGEKNDVLVGTGDYYTIAQQLAGRYYAILDGVDISAYGPCVRIARTVVLDCDQPQLRTLRLSPSLVTPGEPLMLSNLDATCESEITILNTNGIIMHRFHVSGTDMFQLNAENIPGMYLMHVENSNHTSTLRYIVKP